MIDQRAKPRIVIVMEGGLIQSIHADNMPEPACDVIVIDYDTEGADDAHLATIAGSDAHFSVMGFDQLDPLVSTDIGRAYFEWGLD